MAQVALDRLVRLFLVLVCAVKEDLRQSGAFLQPVLYQKLYERFKGRELPIPMLDKILIREFEVEESYASHVAGYFVDGAKMCKILENGQLIDNLQSLPSIKNESDNDTLESEEETTYNNNGVSIDQTKNPAIEMAHINLTGPIDSFVISITGPGMNTKIAINEEDDLLILDAMLNKIKKKLREGSN